MRITCIFLSTINNNLVPATWTSNAEPFGIRQFFVRHSEPGFTAGADQIHTTP
jgi:hypothetical protein